MDGFDKLSKWKIDELLWFSDTVYIRDLQNMRTNRELIGDSNGSFTKIIIRELLRRLAECFMSN